MAVTGDSGTASPRKSLVSIVLPTYNGAAYLGEAIESCQSQDYTNWELIIVDDASTDKTPDIIQKYVTADPRIRAVRHPKNRRLPGALNTGFSQANGQYFTWTSDDNRYRPNAIREMVTFLETHPEVDFVYSDFSRIDEGGAVQERVSVQSSASLIFDNYIGPCFLYKAELQRDTGAYAEDLFLAEDFDYWLRASVRFRLEPLHLDLYLYRMHAQSLSAMRTSDVRWAAERAIARSLPHLKWAEPSLRAIRFLNLARSAHLRSEWSLAARYSALAARTSFATCIAYIARRIVRLAAPTKATRR